jgi:hypothetical protein
MASSEWGGLLRDAARLGRNSEWRVGMAVERSSDHFLSGPASLAGCHVACGILLSAVPRLPEGRDVWFDVADQAGICIHSCQYCGGAWAGKYEKFHSISSHRARFFEGAGDASAACGEGRRGSQNSDRFAHGSVRGRGENASSAHSLVAAKRRHINNDIGCRVAANAKVAIRYSLFAIRRCSQSDRVE